MPCLLRPNNFAILYLVHIENWTNNSPYFKTVQDMRSVTTIHTQEIVYGFILVPKLVTLNDLKRHNGRYFALFYRIFNFFFWGGGDNYATLAEVSPLCRAVPSTRATR